ncbi:MAG: Hsp20/alpha crystallin family protein [Chloroflexi bacterium]|nr:Hsp20/alpha crystallin family protein [Ktedonobacteraceae bacterium]MBV8822517.1 Hsp20/alpha crystallin family protein [Ktedonobacteraceae bacterium]MBV9021932.1 Hsp20/alpha crystallin family protein [Ktedonobacteraceae bacterium]MBV9707821.1 Hsp20/alpha crystallin family protein [Chloroflexota bacterium]
MRMRYRHVTYRYIDGSQKQVEQHYRQLLNDVLRQSQQAMLQGSAVWRPLADILESSEMMAVKIELAGMKEEEIEVTLYEDALVVSGERRDTHEHQEHLWYHEAQVRYGPFRIEVFIPSPIDREAVTARYDNGFLWVDLPKLPESNQQPVPTNTTTQKDTH